MCNKFLSSLKIFSGFWICSHKTMRSWRSCFESMLILTPSSHNEKKYPKQIKHLHNSSIPFGDKSVLSCVNYPTFVYGDDNYGSTTLVPVFTRAYATKTCQTNAPYYVSMNPRETWIKNSAVSSSEISTKPDFVALDSRDEYVAMF